MIPARVAAEPAGQLSVVASIAHDLRNPLAAIQGGAEILVTSILPQTQVQRIARYMYCASVRMRELLEEFLEQSRSLNREVEVCDLHELVTKAVDTVAATAESQAVQIVRVVPEGLAIALDRHRIQRVVVNLLVNALEAMPHGGNIHISAVPDRESVLIRVRDSGPGITPEIQDRLFQPFATAGKANGVGLGLALSRQAVLDHGGDIWAESSLQGACFAVRLPLDPNAQTVEQFLRREATV
jgi:signal transduction histidine kinase